MRHHARIIRASLLGTLPNCGAEVLRWSWNLRMFTRIALLSLIAAALIYVFLMAQPRRGDFRAREYGWISNLDEAKALARKSGKPIMVVLRCEP